MRNAECRINLIRYEHVANQVNHLKRARAVDDNFSIADESKRLVVVICVPANGKHQFKARSVVGGLGLEGVGRLAEQVDVRTCHVVDEVEVVDS